MKVVYALTNISVGAPHGMIVDLVAGEVWDADDQLVKSRPDLFSTVPPKVKTTRGWTAVEQATAAPGEKRNR